MADGVGVSVISDAIQESRNDSTDQSRELNATIDKGIDGLKEIISKPLHVLVDEVPPYMKGVYETLAKMLPGMMDLQDIQKESLKADKNARKEEETDRAVMKDTKKKKQTYKDGDMVKFPAAISAPPLFLGQKLTDLLGVKSPLYGMLKDIRGFLKASGGAVASQTQSVVGPGPLDFKDKGWKALATTLVKFVDATSEMGMKAPLIEDGFKSIKAMGEIIDTCAKMTERIESLAKKLPLLKMGIKIMSIDGPLHKFFKAAIILANAEDWKAHKKKMADLAEFSLSIAVTMLSVTVAAMALMLTMTFVVLAGLMAIPAILAVAGILIFVAAFTLIAILSNKIEPYADKLIGAAISMLISVVLFGLVLLTMSVMLPLPRIFDTIKILIHMAIFTVLFGLVGLLANLLLVGIIALAVAAIAMLIAVVALTVAFVAMEFLTTEMLTNGIIKLALIGLFFLKLIPLIIPFVLGILATAFLLIAAIFLLIAVGALFVAFLVLDFITPARLNGAIERIHLIGEFFTMMWDMVPVLLMAVLATALLLVASLLLLIGVAIFFVALIVLEAVVPRIVKILTMEVEGAAEGMSGVFALMWKFFAALSLLGIILIPAAVASVLLAITAILTLVGFVALLGAVAIGIKLREELGNLEIAPLMGRLSLFFLSMIPIGIAAALALIPLAIIVPAALLMLGAFVALIAASAIAGEMSKKTEKLNVPLIRKKISELMGIFNAGMAVNATKVLIIGLPVLAAAAMMASIFKSIVDAYRSLDELGKIQTDSIDPTIVFGAVERLAELVAISSEKTKDASLLALVKFDIGMGAIIRAIEGIVNVITQLVDFDMGMIENANKNLRKILDEFFGSVDGSPAPGSVLSILDGVEGIGRRALRTVEALVPLTEAIGNITGVVRQVMDIQNIDQGIANTRSLVNFVAELADFAATISGQGRGSGLFGGGPSQMENAKKTLEQMEPVVDQLTRVAQRVGGFDGAKLNNEFVKQMRDFATVMAQPVFSGSNAARDMGRAADTVSAAVPIFRDFGRIGGDAASFENIRVNIEGSIIEPLLRLEGPISTLQSLNREIHNLNDALSRLTRDNRNTIASIGQLGNASSSRFGSIISTIAGMGRRKDTEEDGPMVSDRATVSDADDPLADIRDDVRKIAEKLTNPESWTKDHPTTNASGENHSVE